MPPPIRGAPSAAVAAAAAAAAAAADSPSLDDADHMVYTCVGVRDSLSSAVAAARLTNRQAGRVGGRAARAERR
jgi:hypothetical protein